MSPLVGNCAKFSFRHARPAPVCVRPYTSLSRKTFSSRTSCRASGHEHGFDAKNYIEATVDNVRTNDQAGPTILLRIMDGSQSGYVLPVYVGEPESAALIKELHRRHTARPMTHDLLKNAFEVVGYKVVLVRINALVGTTYHARIHIQRMDGGGPDLDIDARPSDAVNMAVRFKAPILVCKDIAQKMAIADARELDPVAEVMPETHADIVKRCKQEVLMYQDPTVMYNLQLQLAIQEERYEEASMLRDQIEKLISQDRALRLVVAIETALEDHRYEEAARLRDELHMMRKVSSQQTHQSDAGI